jgi:hypothetical protein
MRKNGENKGIFLTINSGTANEDLGVVGRATTTTELQDLEKLVESNHCLGISHNKPTETAGRDSLREASAISISTGLLSVILGIVSPRED